MFTVDPFHLVQTLSCPQPLFYGDVATQSTSVFTGWRNTKDPKFVGNPEEEQRQRTNQPNGLPPMPLGICFLLFVVCCLLFVFVLVLVVVVVVVVVVVLFLFLRGLENHE